MERETRGDGGHLEEIKGKSGFCEEFSIVYTPFIQQRDKDGIIMTKRAVSACLLGKPCRYDGGSKPHATVAQSLGDALPVCPECLGGLPIPRAQRDPRGRWGGRISGPGPGDEPGRAGCDGSLCKGGQSRLAALPGSRRTGGGAQGPQPFLRGSAIYDGSFSGHCRPGDGVTAALLRANGIRVRTEEDQIRE